MTANNSQNQRLIAAFDSGLGGLSALTPLLLKSCENNLGYHLNYLGDLANLPYGAKSKSRLIQLTQSNVEYLLDESQNPKPDILIIACNTASAVALEKAQAMCAQKQVPCVGVIEASCKEAISLNPQRILVLATQSTVNSEAYTQTLKTLGYTNEVVPVACPLFVPFVEEGIVEGPALQWVIQKYLAAVARPNDLAILACTHYPFLLNSLKKEFPFLKFVQAGEALLKQKEIAKLLSSSKESGFLGRPHLNLQFTDNPDESGKLKRFLNDLKLNTSFNTQVRNIRPLL